MQAIYNDLLFQGGCLEPELKRSYSATSLGKVQLEHLKLETLREEHCATDLENRKY